MQCIRGEVSRGNDRSRSRRLTVRSHTHHEIRQALGRGHLVPGGNRGPRHRGFGQRHHRRRRIHDPFRGRGECRPHVHRDRQRRRLPGSRMRRYNDRHGRHDVLGQGPGRGLLPAGLRQHRRHRPVRAGLHGWPPQLRERRPTERGAMGVRAPVRRVLGRAEHHPDADLHLHIGERLRVQSELPVQRVDGRARRQREAALGRRSNCRCRTRRSTSAQAIPTTARTSPPGTTTSAHKVMRHSSRTRRHATPGGVPLA